MSASSPYAGYTHAAASTRRSRRARAWTVAGLVLALVALIGVVLGVVTLLRTTRSHAKTPDRIAAREIAKKVRSFAHAVPTSLPPRFGPLPPEAVYFAIDTNGEEYGGRTLLKWCENATAAVSDEAKQCEAVTHVVVIGPTTTRYKGVDPEKGSPFLRERASCSAQAYVFDFRSGALLGRREIGGCDPSERVLPTMLGGTLID